jgi:hypothetical protein
MQALAKSVDDRIAQRSLRLMAFRTVPLLARLRLSSSNKSLNVLTK